MKITPRTLSGFMESTARIFLIASLSKNSIIVTMILPPSENRNPDNGYFPTKTIPI